MKAFTITTAVGLGLLILSALTIAVLKVEKQKTQIEAYTNTIEGLTNELHTMEVMYLKCVGNVEAEQHGAHYVDGKIKFYKTK
jgi:hypothetical protein